MQTVTEMTRQRLQRKATRCERKKVEVPADFVPITKETRSHVSTPVMCYHLDRQQQTGREWACYGKGPIQPIRVHGRLLWPVARIKELLGV